MIRRILLTTIALSFGLFAAHCQSGKEPLEVSNLVGPGSGTYHPGGEPVALDRIGQAALSPDAPEPEPGVRNRRRMDLDQLALAIHTVTGQHWMSNADGSGQKMFEVLSLTLGKPDFLQSTQEDLNPTLLFSKFLDDAARDVCYRAVEQETQMAPADRRVLAKVNLEQPLTDRAAVNDNLSHLLLTFHGVRAEPGDVRVTNWRWLLDNTEAPDAAPLTPWVNVCTALLTHPDFYSF